MNLPRDINAEWAYRSSARNKRRVSYAAPTVLLRLCTAQRNVLIFALNPLQLAGDGFVACLPIKSAQGHKRFRLRNQFA